MDHVDLEPEMEQFDPTLPVGKDQLVKVSEVLPNY